MFPLTSSAPDIDLFRADGTVDWSEAIQHGVGTCVIKAAMGSLAEFPDLVRNAFVNQQLNENGIINVRFFIRGKPWVVSVDDTMVFYNHLAFMTGMSSKSGLVFAQQSLDNRSIWGAVLEKAWAKVRGNYMAANGDQLQNGVRSLTGHPTF